MIKVLIYLTKDLLEKVDTWANAHGMNRGQAIRFMIIDFFNRESKKD